MKLKSKTIKSLSEDDRPREKMLLKGKQSLSNSELLAILIGVGTTEHNAVELAQLVFQELENNVNELARLNLKELQQFKGIGPAKAVKIAAALELGRRRKTEEAKRVNIIRDSATAYQLLEPHLADLNKEEFWTIFLKQNNGIISMQKISSGGITGTVVDHRLILKEAILVEATGIILAHNHPSGNLSPSQQDISLTKKVNEAAKLLDIRLLDHIIVTQYNYTSLKDEGYF